MLVWRLNVLKIEERNKTQDDRFILLSYYDRLVINLYRNLMLMKYLRGLKSCHYYVIILLFPSDHTESR